jgi:hypothetical protein
MFNGYAKYSWNGLAPNKRLQPSAALPDALRPRLNRGRWADKSDLSGKNRPPTTSAGNAVTGIEEMS